MKKLLISESQLEIYLRDNPLGTTEAGQAKKGLEEAVANLMKLVSQDKLGKVHTNCTLYSTSNRIVIYLLIYLFIYFTTYKKNTRKERSKTNTVQYTSMQD